LGCTAITANPASSSRSINTPCAACVCAQRQHSAQWRRTGIGGPLDGFIDEDGYRALDALNELCETYVFGHGTDTMHGLRLVPAEGDAGEPDPPLVRRRDGEASRIRFRPSSGRNFSAPDSHFDTGDPSVQVYLTMCSSKQRFQQD
jgi:hypothetical protein